MPAGRFSLRFKLYTLLTLLLFITLAGGVVMVWYTYQMEHILSLVIDKEIAAFQVAEELETALINQKGYVSYYFLDGNPDWLRQLGEYRQIFKERLNTALLLAREPGERRVVEQIGGEYQSYIAYKDRVIEYYRTGNRAAGADLHQTVRIRFFKILELCETYKHIHSDRITRAKQEARVQAGKVRTVAGVALTVAFLAAASLTFVLIFQVLGPIRRLSIDTNRSEGAARPTNEIKTLQQSMEGLIENVEQTKFELEKSRENLQQAEKMAMVGKLAAGMAHTIRNPFTSVKMRLFSLNRTLELTESQKDDFAVISEEIRHIDQIVQNFLEFSRPPKLKMQTICPSVVVDNAIQLLEHRIRSYDVGIQRERKDPMPDVEADPEQLKEVLVNIIVNACEAMVKGGTILIEESTVARSTGKMAVIRLRDTGPGIPETIRDKVFQPFFTTKEDGTGLGLSIAARIMEEHRGRLEVHSAEGEGACFTLSLPTKEASCEHHSDRR